MQILPRKSDRIARKGLLELAGCEETGFGLVEFSSNFVKSEAMDKKLLMRVANELRDATHLVN
jgi:hypothetical protein